MTKRSRSRDYYSNEPHRLSELTEGSVLNADYWLRNGMFPIGTRVSVRYDPRELSKVYVPSIGVAEYLDVPYADLRRPPITRAELERARAILTEKGDRNPTEDQIFAVTAAQRRIEDTSRQKTRRARRNTGRRPPIAHKVSKPAGSKSAVDYSRPVIPYKGEEWLWLQELRDDLRHCAAHPEIRARCHRTLTDGSVPHRRRRFVPPK